MLADLSDDPVGTALGGSPTEASTAASVPPPRSAPPAAVLLGVFAVLAFAMTFRSLGRFGSHVVGDSGDAVLVLWILGWVQHAIPHGWDAIWNANIFSDAQNTLAYAEAMLPVAVVAWPLRVLFGTTIGFNVLALATQTAALWFMYRLALRLTRSWTASFVAALAFAFATPLLQQVWHAQLMLTSFLVPLTVLLVVRYFDVPTPARGAAIGVALGVLATSATYYGTMMAVATAVLALGWLVVFRPPDLARYLRGLAVGAAVAAVITVPVALHYIDLQQDPHFRRGADEQFQAHIEDFLSPVPDNYLLTKIPQFEVRSLQGGVESHLFPGIVALAFGALGLVVLVRAVRRPRAPDESAEPSESAQSSESGATTGEDARRDARVALLIALAGLVSLVLAFGDSTMIFGHEVPLPFKVLRHFVPGFSGIRVTARFTVMAQCALALLAAFGLRALFARLGRRVALVALVLISAFVVAETARELPMTRVPEGATVEAVNHALARRGDGTVAELPMKGATDGVAWAYVESPRQYLSLIDDHPRVNGYSGFTPEGFEQLAATVDTFPSAKSLAALARHDVRYVVLRTRLVGDQVPALRAQLDADGVGRYTPATARAMLERLPEACVRRVDRLPGAYLIELRRRSCVPAARVSAP
jgi:hypothetical protein